MTTPNGFTALKDLSLRAEIITTKDETFMSDYLPYVVFEIENESETLCCCTYQTKTETSNGFVCCFVAHRDNFSGIQILKGQGKPLRAVYNSATGQTDRSRGDKKDFLPPMSIDARTRTISFGADRSQTFDRFAFLMDGETYTGRDPIIRAALAAIDTALIAQPSTMTDQKLTTPKSETNTLAKTYGSTGGRPITENRKDFLQKVYQLTREFQGERLTDEYRKLALKEGVIKADFLGKNFTKRKNNDIKAAQQYVKRHRINP